MTGKGTVKTMRSEILELGAALAERMPDPVPQFILLKELQKKSPDSPALRQAYGRVRESKWYLQLAGEQRPDGSWGRFHTQDTKDPVKRRFVTTEQALRRARELALDRADPMTARCIGLMERYIRGEQAWPDTMERHYGFEIAFRSLIAANLALFEPENPLVAAKRAACAALLARACESGAFREEVWDREDRQDSQFLLRAWMVYPLWLLQTGPGPEERLQRIFLEYLWQRREGIYYISNLAPAAAQSLESRRFLEWLATLEALRGFSLFPEFMARGAAARLLGEARRLLREETALPPAAAVAGHYAESWRGKDARRHDLALRILRLLVCCCP